MKATWTPDARRLATLKRSIELARLLAQEPQTLANLARTLGVSERTIRRDIYALQAVGLDVRQAPIGADFPDDDADDDGAEWPNPPQAGLSTRVVLRLDVASWAGLLFQPAA